MAKSYDCNNVISKYLILAVFFFIMAFVLQSSTIFVNTIITPPVEVTRSHGGYEMTGAKTIKGLHKAASIMYMLSAVTLLISLFVQL
jgi:hypothetical protein